MTTTFLLSIERRDSLEDGTIRIAGAPAWLDAMVPSISHFAASAIEKFLPDGTGRRLAYDDVARGLEAVMKAEEYSGAFVTVTMKEEGNS